jgi:hypothetical protein
MESSFMRPFFAALAALVLSTAAAQAKVDILVDKDNQLMTVSVDGDVRYRWPVSTGIPSRETPNGDFRTFRAEISHFSKEFDDAPMPHALFFTKQGHAIHGTTSERQLGAPASHGCVRLSQANAATLYALVNEQGLLKTTVTLTGSSQVALARNPARKGRDVAVRAMPNDAYAVDGINVGQPRGRFGRLAMDDYGDLAPPRPVRPVGPPQAYYAPQPQPYYGGQTYQPRRYYYPGY